MAYNRPKSLDELNSIFDKTVAAEKAIKKNSSKLESGEDSFSSFSDDKPEEDGKESSSAEPISTPISENVSTFIAKFSADNDPEPVKSKPQMTVITPEAPAKSDESKPVYPSHEDEASLPSQSEKASRDDLFKDYARIMSDEEEDDTPSEKKLSRKEKKLLRKKEKAAKKSVQEKNPEDDPAAEAEEPIAEAPVTEDPCTKDPDENTNLKETPSEESPAEDNVDEGRENSDSANTDNGSAEISQDMTEEENDDFNFPEDHIPEWMKDEEEEYEEIDDPLEKKTKAVHSVLKVLLSLILIAVICTGTLATVFKTVVAVNTGKLVSDKYYFFTTYKDYTELGLSKGDLVITEKKFAEEGEVFAYVDYSSKSFEFGKRTDSITKDDGEVLYVTEKDGGRTLVSRDDCKGVIYLTYEGRGDIVSFLTDNYIILIASSVVISLAIILVFALVLKTKKSDGEDSEEDIFAESDEEFEDIFSTIE